MSHITIKSRSVYDANTEVRGVTTLSFIHKDVSPQIRIESRKNCLITDLDKSGAIELRDALNDWIEEED